MDASAISTILNHFPNIDLVSILASITIDKGLCWGVKNICERITKLEYNKYKDTLNAPFFMAFKNTLNIFSDEQSSLYPLPAEFTEHLSLLNDIEISTIFSSPQNIDIPYDENNIYALMTEKFRTYNKIQGVELPEDFYMFWQTTFKREYESAFALFLAEDNSILAQTIIKIFSISMSEINNIKSQLSAIKIDTTKLLYKQEILNQKMDLLSQDVVDKVKDELRGLLNSTLQTQENPNEDKELKKIQKLFDDCDYENCVSYIKLNKDDNWVQKDNAFKANYYNKLGACYLELNEPELAKENFLASIDTDPTYDNPKFNLAQLAIEENNADNFSHYLNLFNNKTSELYHKLMLQKFMNIDNKFDTAKNYLEENCKNSKDYLFYKACIDLQDPQTEDTSSAELCLQKYIDQGAGNTLVARFNLLNAKFNRLSSKIDWRFIFDLNVSGELKISPASMPTKNKDFSDLLDELKKLYSDLQKNKKQQTKLLINIQVKICLSEYMSGCFNSEKSEIENINKFSIENKLDEQTLLEILTINILCNKYSDAHEIYNLLSDETKNNCRNNYILILFGEKKFEKLVNFLNDSDSEHEINEHLKLVALTKTKDFAEVDLYIKSKISNYSDYTKLFCSWLYHDKLFYDDELKIVKEIANKILKEPNNYDANFVYKIAYALLFFGINKEIEELRETLMETYWNNTPQLENFQLGIVYAINLFNKGKIAQCLSIMDVLRKLEPENQDLELLYGQINSLNFNPQTLISNYEKGIVEEKYYHQVGQAYLQAGDYEKAEHLINSLQYIKEQKLNYYYLKFYLNKAKKVDNEIIIRHLKEALDEYPEDLQLSQIIFGFLMHNHISDETAGALFLKSKKIMQANGILQEFQMNMERPMESLLEAMEKFEPHKKYQEREEIYKECLDAYDEFKFPLTLVAEIFKTTPGELFANFIEDDMQQICFSRRTDKDYKEELNLLEINKNIVLNTPTLILLKILEIDEIIFNNFKVKITNNTKMEIETIFTDITNALTEKLVRDISGNPHLITIENKILKYKDFLKTCINQLECAPFKSEITEAIPIITATETLNSKILFDSTVAVQNKSLICSSDAVMHIINRDFRCQDISLLSILSLLVKNNIITPNREALLKFKLIKLGCKYIPITAENIIHILVDKIDNFEKIKSYLNEEFSPESIASVFAELILNIDKNTNFQKNKYLIIGEIFNWFNFCRKGKQVRFLMVYLAKIYSQLSSLTQKCIAHNINLYEPNKKYIENYYLQIAKEIVQLNQNKENEKITNEILRLAFNVSQEIQEKIKQFISNYRA